MSYILVGNGAFVHSAESDTAGAEIGRRVEKAGHEPAEDLKGFVGGNDIFAIVRVESDFLEARPDEAGVGPSGFGEVVEFIS